MSAQHSRAQVQGIDVLPAAVAGVRSAGPAARCPHRSAVRRGFEGGRRVPLARFLRRAVFVLRKLQFLELEAQHRSQKPRHRGLGKQRSKNGVEAEYWRLYSGRWSRPAAATCGWSGPRCCSSFPSRCGSNSFRPNPRSLLRRPSESPAGPTRSYPAFLAMWRELKATPQPESGS